MNPIDPIFTNDSFTLFHGAAADVLATLPTRFASIALTVSPMYAHDAVELDRLVAELLRLVAGPIVIVAPIYGVDWAAAFKRQNVGIKQATYLGLFDLVAANADDIDLPTDPATITELLREIIEQAGTGSIIDPFVATWLIALPSIIAGLKYVGVVGVVGKSIEFNPKYVAATIERKLAGVERREGHPSSLKEAHRAH